MQGKSNVFYEILKYLPRDKFEETVKKHDGDKWAKKFKYWDLFIVLLHGQMSGEMSLRMVGLSHNANYSVGNNRMPRSTLSDCCVKKNPDILMEVFNQLVQKIGAKGKKLVGKLAPVIQLIDSTSIMLKGRGYEWAKDNGRIKGLKMHTLYDHNLKCPSHFSITSANINDIEEAEALSIKRNRMYVFDKGYCDFSWWNEIHAKGSYFVTRLKKGSRYDIQTKATIKSSHIKQDQTIKLTTREGKRYQSILRYVEVELENKKSLVLVSNDLGSSAERIAALYKERWKIELFFKCLKQNLKVKRFWGKSENAAKLQIIVAMIVYVLLRLIQMATLSHYSLKEIGVILRVNMGNALSVRRLLKIPEDFKPSGTVRMAKV